MSFITNFLYGKNSADTYTVERLPNGRFGVISTKLGTIFNSYSRKRDAFRGAERAGLTLA